MSDALPIRCPACDAGYLLPTHLLGEQGARVRCPACQHGFAVSREGALLSDRAEAGATPATHATVTATSNAPRDIAADLLVALEAREPGAMQHAASEGRLFALHGPELLDAYDQFRKRGPTQSGGGKSFWPVVYTFPEASRAIEWL